MRKRKNDNIEVRKKFKVSGVNPNKTILNRFKTEDS